MSIPQTIPNGWKYIQIGELIRKFPLTGRKLPQREYLQTGKYPVIDQGQKFIGGYTDEELLVECDLPVVVFGDHTKETKLINFPFVAGADGIKVIKPAPILSTTLFYYFLQAIELPNKGYARHFQYLEKEYIPVPPLHEQERIVAKIEELFSQLEAGTAALRRIQAGLKRYKASLLKAACEGRLVESGIRNRELSDGELPAGWQWTSVGEIGTISGGITKNSNRNSLPMKLPYLRVANVYANELRLETILEIGVGENEIQRAILEDGDLLVVEGNGSADQIGRVAIWNGSISPCVHQNHIIKVRFEPKEIAEYVLYWLLSDSGRDQITQVASSTSGLFTLNLSKVSSLRVPLPPLSEQRLIVAEIERRMSVAAEIEASVEANLERSARLRQAILKQAFEGELIQ